MIKKRRHRKRSCTCVLYARSESLSSVDFKRFVGIDIIYIFYLQAQMPDPKTYKQHFENKHPKNELPDDLKNI